MCSRLHSLIFLRTFLVGSEASFEKEKVNVVYGYHHAVDSTCSWGCRLDSVLREGFQ